MIGLNNKMRSFVLFAIGMLIVSCAETEQPMEWVYKETIELDDVNPIGMTISEGAIWLSDGDHNRVVQIDEKGNVLKQIDSLERPMHIDSEGKSLFVPQYGNDQILVANTDPEDNMQLMVFPQDSLDAPASISIWKGESAIADFYNNRILYKEKDQWISFGKEGNGTAEFYYPTDVQITDSLIWVADAYNHRIQVFDKEGKFVKMMGQDQKMNAATGLFVSDSEVIITDFENNRVLTFDHRGQLKQILNEGVHKATDVMVHDETLYILNYRKGELVRYQAQEKKE